MNRTKAKMSSSHSNSSWKLKVAKQQAAEQQLKEYVAKKNNLNFKIKKKCKNQQNSKLTKLMLKVENVEDKGAASKFLSKDIQYLANQMVNYQTRS